MTEKIKRGVGRPRELTQKMKNFCHEYMKHFDKIEAYMAAYDTTDRKIANNEACKLLKRDDVTAYLAELNKPLANTIANEREKKRRILWKRIERSIEKEDETAIARYMDILNKMDLEYVNINRNIDETGKELAQLDTDKLKELLEVTSE